MICKRRFHRLRSSNTLPWLVTFIVFLGMFLTYRTLSNYKTTSHPFSSMPTLSKKTIHYQGLQHKEKIQEFQKWWIDIFGNITDNGTNSSKVKIIKDILSLLNPTDWKTAQEPDEVAIILHDKMLELNLSSHLTCHEIDDLQIVGNLGSSSKKYVERIKEPDAISSNNHYYSSNKEEEQMALKSQASDVHTKIACMKQIYNADFCNSVGNYELMKEIFFLSLFQHPSLIHVLGYCLRGDRISLDIRQKGLMLVMEAGVPLTPSFLNSLTWTVRVQMALNIAELLLFLDLSPLGSLALPHVELKDFVVINKYELKLTDLDELEYEERECSQNSACDLKGTPVGVQCQENRCTGLNRRINLLVIGQKVLIPLLNESPAEEKDKINEIVQQITHLDISPHELVSFMEKMAEKYDVNREEDFARIKVMKFDKDSLNNMNNRLQENDMTKKPYNSESVLVDEPKDELINPKLDNYLRLDSSNFPGKYDYTCSESHVIWGCVMTVSSLKEAKNFCSSDPNCKAFVVFSTQPEKERKLTVVFKNKGSGEANVNLGTTLFILRSESTVSEDSIDSNKVTLSKQDTTVGQADIHTAGATDKLEPLVVGKTKEMHQCLKRNFFNQADALSSREKRLMAHMGLKDVQEKDWKHAVLMQSVRGFSNLQPLSGNWSQGGTMQVHFNTTGTGHGISRAKFMAEDSEIKSHIAFYLVYYIDRLLGLYHTPPAVEGYLRSRTVRRFSTNSTWKSTFGSMILRDGTLRGLYVAPTPRVVKKSKLSLKPLSRMVTVVVPFDRTQKMQLEYVLLWWLGHIYKPADLHRGFKGHLVHTDADQGFQQFEEFGDYFNHCQFPNVVHKLLMCFHCREEQMNKICFLGQEVVRQVETAGFHLSDLHTKQLTQNDYPSQINKAASSVLKIIEQCIRDFGRETVLY